MANVPNTRKVFNFRIEIEGVDQFEVQSVQIPEVEIDVVTHGGENRDVKTPGRVNVGNCELTKVRPMATADNWAWAWLRAAQDPLLGIGSPAAAIKRTVIIKELGADNITPVNTYILLGCWVSKIASANLDRNSSDNLIETVTLAVDDISKL